MKQIDTTEAAANGDNRLTKIANYVLAFILILIPFHAFLTVFLSQFVGHYGALRVWKDALLLAMVPFVLYLGWKTPGLWDRVKSGWLLWCLCCYGVLNVALGLIALQKHQVNAYSLIFAWVTDLRFLLVFAIAFVLAARSRWLRNHWEQILIWPAVLVIAFALLQLFVLPTNFLGHFGYDSTTIQPFDTVDQKLDYVRIQSTLRGANPLGAYLVLVLAALVVLLLKSKRDKRQIMGITMLSAGLLALLKTYSRSAYVGFFLAALAAVALVVHGRKAKLRLAYALVGLVVVGTGALLTLRTNDRFENTFFHTDEHSTSDVSSNASRTQKYKTAVHQVATEPFGRGPGTAGPASVHNVQPARLAENYFLQIGQETGWLGLALFVAINLLVAKGLWAKRDDVFARFLLASLLGLSFVNLTLHAWADDTLGLLWWALAGIALAPMLSMPAKAKPATLVANGGKAFEKTKND